MNRQQERNDRGETLSTQTEPAKPAQASEASSGSGDEAAQASEASSGSGDEAAQASDASSGSGDEAAQASEASSGSGDEAAQASEALSGSDEAAQARLEQFREQLEDVPEWDPPDRRSLRARLEHLVERWSKRVGIRQILRLLVYQTRVRRTIEEVPRRMQLVTNQARLVLELIEDFVHGRYRAIPWHSVAVAAAALVYSVSPADVFPDYLPVVGVLDDMVFLSLAMRWVEKDLRAYCEFKGYDASEYFEIAR